MAHDLTDAVGSADADYAEHLRTYRLFLRLVHYSLIGAVVILILLAFITL